MGLIKYCHLQSNFIKQLVVKNEECLKMYSTDSGFPMIFATALVASLRMSEAITGSTGMLVKRFKVGIAVLLLQLSTDRTRPSGG